ncbi:efflux RND transporter periplasmic adaptor subunit [Roseateles cellulosilyticus]|uniref:Efflux RND transporter periplasmic adaptor subunit n=1 Tax=Pelomonas cellulosilytica TaxID=2906762 RepID=A0ABS8XZX5_9BURK|nr:efflux RND transporter periplasmic adaptor subunit [Pelomonas sp. P8]MCE4556304.1 efflux RND transporter periplasmic adaptor subunit [Pelomonas sp. P8]
MGTHSRQWIAAGVVGLVLVGAAAWGWWRGHALPSYTVLRGEFVQTIVASGHVETPHRIDIGAQITAPVVAVPVAEGQRVERGQLLMQLDDRELAVAVQAAQAQVAQAEAKLRQLVEVQAPVSALAVRQARLNMDNARAQAKRQADLFQQGFIGQAALDEAVKALDLSEAQWGSAVKQAESEMPSGSEFALARANAEAARSALEAARVRQGYARIVAPATGVLIARAVEAGEQVSPGHVLMTLSPDGATQLVVQIDEKHLRYLALGAPASASSEAYPEQRFQAQLAFVNPGINAQTGAVTVKLDVPRPPAGLQQDMTVSVNIEVARHADAIVVPSDAVRDPAGASPWVMRVEGGRARRVAVRLGASAGGRTEIVVGLQAGDRVLPATVTVRDGEHVRLASPT